MLAAMPAAEAIPASSCPCSIATATAAPTAPQMDVACRPRSKNTELRMRRTRFVGHLVGERGDHAMTA